MSKLVSTLAVSVALALAVAGCGGSDNGDGGSKSKTPSSGVSSTKPQSVVMKNIAFNPKQIPVPPGATVTWTNKDTAAHDVTGSDFKSGAKGGLNPGDT